MCLSHQDQIGIHVALHSVVPSNIYSRFESGHIVSIVLQGDGDHFVLDVFSLELHFHWKFC